MLKHTLYGYIFYISLPLKRASDIVLSSLPKIRNLLYKLNQKFYKVPLFKTMQERAYQKATNNHARFLPLLDYQSASILERLRSEGTCVVSLNELKLSSTDNMMRNAFTLANSLRQQHTSPRINQKAEIGSNKEDLKEFPEILLWALEPKLLDIIENYIGLPILYQGFAMRRSIADGESYGVRRWHLDWEDRRTIKIIIYLNNVTAGGGPYEYIRRTVTSQAVKTLARRHLSDLEMLATVPREDWTACLADVGNIIITDTSSVFHRAQPPIYRERFSITFCYTSANPRVFWKSRKISPQQRKLINSKIDRRQKGCLPKKQLRNILTPVI